MRLVLCVVACCSLPSNAAVEDRKWRYYQSEHFHLYSDRAERIVAEQIKGLELFRAAVYWLTGLEPRKHQHRTDILLLGRNVHFKKLFRKQNVIGFMQSGTRRNLLVVGNTGGTSTGPHEVSFHSYVHYLVRNVSVFRYPPWYDEGFAELLSTLIHEDGFVMVGRAPAYHAYMWANEPRMSLSRMFSTKSLSELSRTERSQFNTTSWLFVHYVMFSEASRSNKLVAKNSRFLELLNGGQPWETAFVTAFEIGVDEMYARIKEYAGESLPIYEIPDHLLDFEAGYQSRDLNRDEAAYFLAYAINADNPGEARRMLRTTFERNPEDWRALAGIGVTYQMEGDFATARKLTSQALDRDEGDYLLHIEYADALQASCLDRHSECVKEGVPEKLLTHYQRAYELEPDLLETNFTYASQLIVLGKAAEALPKLLRARELLPSHYLTTRRLGEAYLASGNLVESRRYLDRANGWAADSPQELKRVAKLLAKLDKAEREQIHSEP